MINELSVSRVLSLIFLSIMVGQYGAVAAISFYRVRQGRNGITVSLLFNALALALFAGALFLYILVPLPEDVVMVSMLGVVLTNSYLIFSMWAERNKPLKKQPYVMEKLHLYLEKELDKGDRTRADS